MTDEGGSSWCSVCPRRRDFLLCNFATNHWISLAFVQNDLRIKTGRVKLIRPASSPVFWWLSPVFLIKWHRSAQVHSHQYRRIMICLGRKSSTRPETPCPGKKAIQALAICHRKKPLVGQADSDERESLVRSAPSLKLGDMAIWR